MSLSFGLGIFYRQLYPAKLNLKIRSHCFKEVGSITSRKGFLLWKKLVESVLRLSSYFPA